MDHCLLVNIIKKIFVKKLRLHESRDNLALPFGLPFAFDFLQFASVKCLKIFTDCEVCRTDHLKSEKNRGHNGIFQNKTFLLCNLRYKSERLTERVFIVELKTKLALSLRANCL